MTNKKQRILIVEDVKALSHALVLRLEDAGFATHAVENGTLALEALKREHYDLLLLDLIMPVKNGFEVLEEMKKQKLQPRVVVVSNIALPEDVQRVRSLGAVDFLVKADTPLTVIIEKVQNLLSKE